MQSHLANPLPHSRMIELTTNQSASAANLHSHCEDNITITSFAPQASLSPRYLPQSSLTSVPLTPPLPIVLLQSKKVQVRYRGIQDQANGIGKGSGPPFQV